MEVPATVADVSEVASAAVAAARTDEARQVEVIAEHAAAAIDDAHAQTEALARAAMETELGRGLAALEGRTNEWHAELEGLRDRLSQLATTVSDLQTQVAAAGTLALVAATEPSSSTPQLSPQGSETVAEAVEAVTEVIPALEAPALVESTPSEKPRRLRVFR